jgi:excinuclease UvrABC nuclease subunit
VSAVPFGEGHYVYQLLRSGEVVYVGQTGNAFQRIANHQRDGKKFDDVRITVCDSKEERMRLERELIGIIRPIWNRDHNPDANDWQIKLADSPMGIDDDHVAERLKEFA